MSNSSSGGGTLLSWAVPVSRYTLWICPHFDWQVSSVDTNFHSISLSRIFSAVTHFTLPHGLHSQSSEEVDEVDRIEWHNLSGRLATRRSFRPTTIGSPCISFVIRNFNNGELRLELLPELRKLCIFENCIDSDVSTSFIDARQNAGHS